MQTLSVSLNVFKTKISGKKVKKVSTKKHPTFVELTLAVSSGSQTVLAKFSNCSCTIGGHKNLGQTSQLYKVKNQKYTLGKFGFLQTRL
jgi:hypothetical protein